MSNSERAPAVDELVLGVLDGKRSCIARAISMLERRDCEAPRLMRALIARSGKAKRTGITGPPGVGKSTLLGALARALASRGEKIAILAVDPSSPLTHGAVLGDRVRMMELDRAEGVYIRSMASRGLQGGLGPHVADAAEVLDAAGFDWIFVESVGVGQVELDIRTLVDTTMVVLVPESGDQVQAIKAGLMEIADIYIVNKSDRDGAAEMIGAVQSATAMRRRPEAEWMPGVLAAAASRGQGLAEILVELERHRAWLAQDGRLQRRRRAGIEERLRRMLHQQLAARFDSDFGAARLDEALRALQSGASSLDEIAHAVLDDWLRKMAERT